MDLSSVLPHIIELWKDVNATQSVLITIENNSNAALDRMTRAEDAHSNGGFRGPLPKLRIEPGDTDSFVSQDSENSILTGTEGSLKYNAGGMGQAEWTITWNNAAIDPFGRNEVTSDVEGPEGSFYLHSGEIGDGNRAHASFVISGGPPHLGPPPKKKRKKEDGDDDDEGIDATCIVTVVNDTATTLHLVNQGHERGGFLSFPAGHIDPGESDSFASVETQGAETGGSKGFAQYRVGDGDTFVTLEWDNPEDEDNGSAASVAGGDGSVTVLEQVGAGDENVPFTFTVSGGSDTPPPEPEWAPPVEVEQPTLRMGDDNPDGWVEYLQELLNLQIGAGLAVDGDFGSATQAAVRRLQRDYDIQVDGVVGYQTWAVLRGETPAPASTDGRAPHTYVEQGAEARWWGEGQHGTGYDPAADTVYLSLVSVGTQLPQGLSATIRFTGNDTGEVAVLEAPLGEPITVHAEGGADYVLEVAGLREAYGSGVHTVEAYLPAELGGDYTTFQIRLE